MPKNSPYTPSIALEDEDNLSYQAEDDILSSKKEKPKNSRQKFTPEEDSLLQSLVGDEKFPNWTEISTHISGKTGRQCRVRYQHYLAPTLDKDPWRLEEDRLIIKCYSQYGPNWAIIAGKFNGRRSNNNIKNRWNNHLRFLFIKNNKNSQNSFNMTDTYQTLSKYCCCSFIPQQTASQQLNNTNVNFVSSNHQHFDLPHHHQQFQPFPPFQSLYQQQQQIQQQQYQQLQQQQFQQMQQFQQQQMQQQQMWQQQILLQQPPIQQIQQIQSNVDFLQHQQHMMVQSCQQCHMLEEKHMLCQLCQRPQITCEQCQQDFQHIFLEEENDEIQPSNHIDNVDEISSGKPNSFDTFMVEAVKTESMDVLDEKMKGGGEKKGNEAGKDIHHPHSFGDDPFLLDDSDLFNSGDFDDFAFDNFSM